MEISQSIQRRNLYQFLVLRGKSEPERLKTLEDFIDLLTAEMDESDVAYIEKMVAKKLEGK